MEKGYFSNEGITDVELVSFDASQDKLMDREELQFKTSLPQPVANVHPCPGTYAGSRAGVDVRADYRILSLPNGG